MKQINDDSKTEADVQDTGEKILDNLTYDREVNVENCHNLSRAECLDIKDSSNLEGNQENFGDFQNNEAEENQNGRAEQIRAFQEKLKKAMLEQNMKKYNFNYETNNLKNIENDLKKNEFGNGLSQDSNKVDEYEMEFQDSFNQKENVLYDQNKVEKLNKEDMDFKDDHKKNEVHSNDTNENIDRMDFEDSFCENIKQGHGDSNNENIEVKFFYSFIETKF